MPLPRRVASSTAFVFTAYAFVATMLGTTLPTPLYPQYEVRFDFGALMVTIVFATYAVGVLAALLVFGRASDTVGRRPTLLAGLLVSLASSLVFLGVGQVHGHAAGLTLLFLGRFLSGLSAGVFTGTATAALSDFAGDEHRTRASLVAAVANIGGLGLGPLTAGLLAEHVAHPLTTPYLVHAVLVAAAIALLVAMPEPVEVQLPRRLTVQRLGVPADVRARFVQAVTAGFAGFAVLGFFTAVTPATLGLLGHHDPALTGLVVFVVFAASAAGQVLTLRLGVERALVAGTGVLVAGIACVGVGIGERELWLIVVGGVISGLGQGASFRSALGSVTGASPPQQRAAVSSSFFAVCYVGISLPVVGIGAATDAYGLVHTAEVFAGIIAALAVAALVAIARSGSTA